MNVSSLKVTFVSEKTVDNKAINIRNRNLKFYINKYQRNALDIFSAPSAHLLQCICFSVASVLYEVDRVAQSV